MLTHNYLINKISSERENEVDINYIVRSHIIFQVFKLKRLFDMTLKSY